MPGRSNASSRPSRARRMAAYSPCSLSQKVKKRRTTTTVSSQPVVSMSATQAVSLLLRSSTSARDRAPICPTRCRQNLLYNGGTTASNNGRVVKFSRDGRFIKTWGHKGSAPGDFDDPHDIFVGGSLGRVYVADRRNSRIQIFDQDGNFITAWHQFGQPSSIFVGPDDTLMSAPRSEMSRH